jgi:hypothetical protein
MRPYTPPIAKRTLPPVTLTIFIDDFTKRTVSGTVSLSVSCLIGSMSGGGFEKDERPGVAGTEQGTELRRA